MLEEVFFRKQSDEVVALFKNTNVIKVLTGMRRSGKSYLLKMVRENLKKSGVPPYCVIYIDFEDFENSRLFDVDALFEFVRLQSEQTHSKLYLLFDEIQEVPFWEKCINALYSSEKIDCDIYITGSNAKLLSSELATYISGRYVNISVFPFSYAEYLGFYQKEDSSESFFTYMKYGGFPGLKNMNQDEISRRSYLEGIYSTVLLKDIITKNQIRDISLLEKIIQYVTNNIGNIFSAKRISDFMKSSGRKLAVETVYNHLQYLQNALYLYKVPRYDLKGKKLLETMEKYYVADTGLYFYLFGFKDSAINGLLENIVFIELKRRGYNVAIGKIGNYEIDFVAEKGGVTEYFQVTYLLASAETVEREYKPLQMVSDNFPKTILSLDDLPESNTDGIIRKNIRKWLLENA